MRRADAATVLSRLRNQSGFGVLELVAAMSMLSIGLLALVAAFNSGAIVLHRSAKVSTANVLAERQLERYHAIRHDQIELAADPDATQVLYNASRPTGTPVSFDPTCTAPACNAIQTVTGPDGRSYRIDTYIVLRDFAESPGAALRPVKLVRVVVRDGADLTKVLVARDSTFDEASAPTP